ncbi:TolC family protein [Hahella ganghwensis]|uniref:TolC family protein n=1 Tax=Hahella ganghwensis TaxID=286420 RepID=UPI0003A0FDB7|nr:TolC family protein [Hahella ganghwensis]
MKRQSWSGLDMLSEPISLKAVILTSLGLITGCTTAPQLHDSGQLPFRIEPQWQVPDIQGAKNPAIGWVTQFGSRQLEQWITIALQNNLNLLAAREKLRVAGYQLRRVQASGGVQTVSQIGVEKSRSLSGDRGSDSEGWSLQLNVSWELDLWGKQDALEEQARWQSISAEHEFQYLAFSLSAQVAQAWITIAELSLLEQLQQNARDNWADVERSVRRDVSRGQANTGDLQNTLTDLALAESALEKTRRQLGESLRSIQVILGQYPTADRHGLSAVPPTTLPQVPMAAAMDSPADIMMHRPDILMAQAELAASDAAAFAAYADLFPRLSLNLIPQALTGDLSSLGQKESSITASASLFQTLFDRRALLANKDQARSQADQSYWRYTHTLLNAFFEVEQTIHNEQQLQREWQALKRAQEAAIHAANIDKRDYQRGLITLRDYLGSQRRAIELSQQSVSKHADRLRNWVALQLALGRPSMPEKVSS